jgi:hypothetical protein
LLSTPGDLDSAPAQEAVEIINDACRWTEKFYDMKKQEVHEYVEKNSQNGIVYIEYNHKQLGLDEDWVKRTAQTLLNDPLMIKREIYLKRIRGSQSSPFNQEDLDEIGELQKEVIEEIFINKFYKLDVYEPLVKNKVYIVSVDCSHGTGSDNTAVTVGDPYSEKPVAEFKSPYIGTEDAKKFLYILVKKYIPKAILCVERNHVGAAIIEGLKSMGLIANLYFDNTKVIAGGDIDDKLDPSGFLKQQAFNRRLYGVYTEKGSREVMFNLLFTRVTEKKDKFVCRNIINDLLHLVRNKQGKIVAGPGFNDDSIMSYLIFLYVLYYGNNLERYGFVRGHAPSEDDRNRGLFNEYEDYESLPDEIKQNIIVPQPDRDSSFESAQEIFNEKMRMDIIDRLTSNSGHFRPMDEDDMDTDTYLSLCDELNN